MREIKFRAWFEMEKKMVTHDRLSISYDNGEGFTFAFDDWGEKGTLNYILMQYTGLKDKYGKEIYEGDIVSEKWQNPLANKAEDDRYLIEFEHGQYRLRDSKKRPGRDRFLFMQYQRVEVIGNIYKNPELLEVKTCE